MIPPHLGSYLHARLLLVLGERASVLLASARDREEADALARAVVQAAGEAARLVDLRSAEGAMEQRRRLQSLAADPPGLVIVCGGGVLDSAEAVMALGMVEAVVLVARRGKTLRIDLDRARVEIERTRARLIGSVLLD